MSNPVELIEQIDRDASDLDRLSKAIHDATSEVERIEEKWDVALDTVMAALEDEFAEAGRKSVPEHTAISAARREHRTTYQEFRRAKRRLEKLQMQLHAKRAAINGRQSELSALKEELRAMA